MNALWSVQTLVLWVLSVGCLALQGFCLVDAARHRADAFPATSNQTKVVWLAMLGAAMACGVISLPNFYGPVNMFNLIALVVCGVYLTRVRPSIVAILGGRRGDGGPYGGW